jgi:hypothetical protein
VLDDRPNLPVAPWATALPTPAPFRELEIHEVDERVVAGLVRARLALEKGRGWLLLTGLVTTVAAVVGLGVSVQSKVVLGVLAPLVASVPFSVGLFAERAAWLTFQRLARGQGLSERASRRVFDGALGADHWIAVLTSCGRAPSDGEIARFVLASR